MLPEFIGCWNGSTGENLRIRVYLQNIESMKQMMGGTWRLEMSGKFQQDRLKLLKWFD